MATAVKTERITILATPEFKTFLNREAKKEGKSLSELVGSGAEISLKMMRKSYWQFWWKR